MRVLILFAVLLACVAPVGAADTAAPEQESSQETKEEKPAFTVNLQVRLPVEDALLETAVSLVEDLRATPNIGGFDFGLRMWEQPRTSASLDAWFSFDGLQQLVEWYRRDSVQSLLLSLEEASGEPLELSVRGVLVTGR